MRVAIFTEGYFPFISGVITHVETLRKGLEAQGHTVLIVTLSPDTKKHYIKDNILYCPAKPMKNIYGNGITNPLNHYRLRIIRAFRPDIIHVQTEFSIGMFGIYCARKLDKPVVHTLHTMYDDYLFYLFPPKTARVTTPLAHAYFRGIASKATETIGPSVKVADFLRNNLKIKRNVNIIPNTVDLSKFVADNVAQADIDAVKHQLGIKKGDVTLCFVGRIGKEKSIDVLVDYFGKSFGGNKRFKLFIIGDGPQEATVKAQIARLKLQDQVFALGRIDHALLPPYYQAFDLFTTASISEMNSISLLESNASGLYAVQRFDPKNRDQIEHGVNGEEFHTAEEFKNIVLAYDKLPAAEKKARRAAVGAYARRYGPREFTAAVLQVYEKALKKHNKQA